LQSGISWKIGAVTAAGIQGINWHRDLPFAKDIIYMHLHEKSA
jgi:hypothetical protein